jgi:hypothetical protein
VAKPENIRGAGRLAGNPRGFREVIDANSYLWEPQPDGLKVCVEGGSATAAWCVQRAIERKARGVLWISRSGFLAANPAGRNSETIKLATSRGWMHVGKVDSITVAEDIVAEGSRRLLGGYASVYSSRLELRLAGTQAEWSKALSGVIRTDHMGVEGQKAAIHNLASRGPTEANEAKTLKLVEDPATVRVDQYVYASGQDPKVDQGAGRFVHLDLVKHLVPRFDPKRFGHEQTVVAFSTPKEWPCSLWLVGAAVFQSLGNKNIATLNQELEKSYFEMADVLCKENSPPEGVPLVNASLNALMDITQNTDKDKFNWKIANLADLEAYLNRYYGLRANDPRGIILSPLAVQQAARDIASAQRGTTGGFNQMQWDLVVKATVAKYSRVALNRAATTVKTGFEVGKVKK